VRLVRNSPVRDWLKFLVNHHGGAVVRLSGCIFGQPFFVGGDIVGEAIGGSGRESRRKVKG